MTEPQPRPVDGQPVENEDEIGIEQGDANASATPSACDGAEAAPGTEASDAFAQAAEAPSGTEPSGTTDGQDGEAAASEPAAESQPDKDQVDEGRDIAAGDDAAAAADTAPAGPPGPRLDRVSAHLAQDQSNWPHRRTVDLAADEDDEEDATFGPKLAAWLQSYRERQAANGNGSKQQVKVLPAAADAGMQSQSAPQQAAQSQAAQPQPAHPQGVPQQMMAGPASAAWAGRAQVAFDEMLATSPPPEWLAARRGHEGGARRSSNWLLVASIALLMAGTATVAFVAAARNAGVDPSLGTVVAAFNSPAASQSEAVVVVEQTTPKAAALAGQQSASPAPSAPAPAAMVPRVEIVDTRVVAPAIAASVAATPAVSVPAASEPAAPAQSAPVRAAAPAAPTPAPAVAAAPEPEPEPIRRSTLFLPTETRSAEARLDHPQSAPAPAVAVNPPVRSKAVEAAIVEASTREPGQPGATAPQSPPEVRVASLNPMIQMTPQGSKSSALNSTRQTSAPSMNGLVQRAGLLLESGDVVAARMLFELAARGGDASAAVGAGLTYDPVQFERLGVRGIQPDAELALAWYERALGDGEKGALDEIERLKAWLARQSIIRPQ